MLKTAVVCDKLTLSEGGDAAVQEEKIQWHPGFFAGMGLELKGYHLNFESEHELTRGPLYIDILIIRKLTDEKIDNEIGEIFRRHNIVEYKSPNDELSIDVFFKVQAYACGTLQGYR